MPSSTDKKLQIAVIGLGRMGMRHARHFAHFTPRAELVAVTSPVQSELDAAAAEFGARTYLDYKELLDKETGLDAIVVSSVTAVHVEHAVAGIERGLHVLCEKPFSTSPEKSQLVVDAYNKSKSKFPKQKVLCGFSRRFDASYRDAYTRVARGDIGVPSVFRSQTCDKLDPSGFFVAYAEFSGGIFVDCSIHDIDLALWFLGEDSKIKSLSAVGITAVQPDLRKHNDRDNAVAILEFQNGKIGQLYASRMMAAGQEDTTEIFGTAGKIAINTQPTQNHVQLYEANGIRREIPQDYYGRFREAFITEANEFTAAALDDTPLPFGLEGSVTAVRIGSWLQESLISGKKIDFDEAGNRIN